jgi:hypothetical protein
VPDADVLAEVSAAADAKAKKTRLGRIAAAREERNPDFLLAQGILHRAGLNVEDVTDARTFDRLCAASARPPSAQDKMVVKSAFFRLGILLTNHVAAVRILPPLLTRYPGFWFSPG